MFYHVALGANLPGPAGEAPRTTLESALVALEARGHVIRARSRWYANPAFPVGSGPDFVNGVVEIESAASPEALISDLLAVEASLGRSRGQRWAARICDLDLIAAEDLILPDIASLLAWIGLPPAERSQAPERLLVPHPRLQERAFVLVPLADIAPDWQHPVFGITARALCAALPDSDRRDVVPL